MNRVYDLLPLPLKSAMVTAFSVKSNIKKYGADFRKHLRFLKNSDADARAAYANERLRDFLAEQSKTSSFYRIRRDDSLTDLPIIEKSDVLSNIHRLLSQKPYKTNKSSGSTGEPLKVFYNREVYQNEYAYWWYHRGYCGLERGDRIATLAGHKVTYIDRRRPPYWAYNWRENQLLMSSYHMAPSTLEHYVTELNRFQPKLIHGYPSSIYLVAKHVVASGQTLEFEPRMVITASETLLDFQAATIRAAFGCKPYVWYGNTELCGHATECEHGRLHSQPTHSILRVVDESGLDVAPGDEGTIVATNFVNRCMPLINYNTKDRAIVSRDQTCLCNRGGLLLDSIIGRVEDYVITSDGRRVGRLDHLFKDARHVANAQVIQNEPGAVTIRIEKADGYTSRIENTIRTEARRRLGKDTALTFDYDTQIRKDANGKFSFIVQNYRPGSMASQRL
jgi:phenylacetate-CoA ligase